MKKEIVFDFQDCIEVVLELLPDQMKEKFGWDEVGDVLYFKNEYLMEIGIAGNPPKEDAPLIVDNSEVEHFILSKVKEDGWEVTLEEVRTILAGEFEYMDRIGLITDFGPIDN